MVHLRANTRAARSNAPSRFTTWKASASARIELVASTRVRHRPRLVVPVLYELSLGHGKYLAALPLSA